MDSSLITLLVIVVLLVIAGLAYAVYKAGFRAKKVTVKTPVFEAEMERKATDDSPAAPTSTQPAPAQFTQQATDGGVITKARIQAPADTSTSAHQKAEGEGSRLDDAQIKLD
jgi:hypothetical protein